MSEKLSKDRQNIIIEGIKRKTLLLEIKFYYLQRILRPADRAKSLKISG